MNLFFINNNHIFRPIYDERNNSLIIMVYQMFGRHLSVLHFPKIIARNN